VPVIEWREAARDDLLAIVDYISDDNPEAAQQLKDDIETRWPSWRDILSYTAPVVWPALGRWSSEVTTW
jgi:plasmid stabilization system protein ParE